MSIKLIALDLDDTLLDSRKRISPSCAAAIKKAREKGVLVTLATGRMYRMALPYAQELEIDLPLITYQGAWVKNSFSGEVLYYKPLPNDLARDIMNFFREKGVYYHSYFNDLIYIEKSDEYGRIYTQQTGLKPVLVENLMQVLENNEALEIMAMIEDEDMLLDIEEQLRTKYKHDLHINRFLSNCLEIMHKKATKPDALQVIADHYGIAQQEVMAVGDSYNDISMLSWAGLGVAMGNANPMVKEVADYITLSNDEQGVAEAIRLFVL